MNHIITRDQLTNMILGLVAALMILFMQPKADQDPISQPGNLAVSIAWPEGNTDVDLWVLAPGDKAVGYSRRGGKVMNLLRDDTGTFSDVMPFNREDAYSRGLPDGEYIINLHAYRTPHVPLAVSVEVRMGSTGDNTKLILQTKVELVREGQERTVARFIVRNGAVVEGSMNNVFAAIRGAK